MGGKWHSDPGDPQRSEKQLGPSEAIWLDSGRRGPLCWPLENGSEEVFEKVPVWATMTQCASPGGALGNSDW
jgi:hypothetical protein